MTKEIDNEKVNKKKEQTKEQEYQVFRMAQRLQVLDFQIEELKTEHENLKKAWFEETKKLGSNQNAK